jgi:hypothetical protein
MSVMIVGDLQFSQHWSSILGLAGARIIGKEEHRHLFSSDSQPNSTCDFALVEEKKTLPGRAQNFDVPVVSKEWVIECLTDSTVHEFNKICTRD